MAPQRFIIWTTGSDNLNKIHDAIYHLCCVMEFISHQVVCVEIQLDRDNIISILKDCQVSVLEIKENTMKRLEGTFVGEEGVKIQKFLDETTVLETIDEILDVINKNGMDLLPTRDFYALYRLTEEL